MGNGKHDKKEIDYRMLTIIFGIIIIILVIILSLKSCSFDFSKDNVSSGGLEMGVIDSNGDEELEKSIQKSLNDKVEAGMASVFINTNIIMDKGEDQARLLIQNGANNNYAQQVRIVIKDTEEIIYESPIIDPGYKIERDYLSKQLDKGNYICEARIDLLNKETYSLVNTVNIKVKLSIKA